MSHVHIELDRTVLVLPQGAHPAQDEVAEEGDAVELAAGGVIASGSMCAPMQTTRVPAAYASGSSAGYG
jgi:hypothetical protein